MKENEALTQIVKRVQQDINQFELLYSEIVNKVFYWCCTIVNDESTAKDLAQESMIKLYYKFHLVKEPETFMPWMYVMVKNVCYNYLRVNKEKSFNIESLDISDYLKNTIEDENPASHPIESYSLKEDKKIIAELIEKLPRRQREVMTLFYLEEFNIEEIGGILGYNVGSVKSRLHYSRKNLKKKIEDYEKKHNTRLYSTTVLPFLGAILKEHSESLAKKQKLTYKKDLYKANNGMGSIQLKNLLSLKSLTIAGVSIGMVAIITIVALSMIGKGGNPLQNQKAVGAVNAFDKSKQTSYIESITQYTFPVRHTAIVSITLEKDCEDKNVGISLKGDSIDFVRNGRDITVNAKENGVYTLLVDGKKSSFTVSNIDPNAPEISNVQKHEGYLELTIADEQGQINYETSYVAYKGEKYPITRGHKVKGRFSGMVTFYLYNQLGQYITYEMKLI